MSGLNLCSTDRKTRRDKETMTLQN